MNDALHLAFQDLDAYIRLPRLGDLTLSPDGERLVVGVQSPNHDATEWTTAIWEVDPTGTLPAQRLTRSVKGEALSAVTSEGELLFSSERDLPPAGDEPASKSTSAIWKLPAMGEAFPVAQRDGGFSMVLTPDEGDVVVLGVKMHAGTKGDEEDKNKREARRKNKVNAILHTTAGVRYWDHDIGLEQTRLRAGRLENDELVDVRDLTGDVGAAIEGAALSRDGSTLAVPWRVMEPKGHWHTKLVIIDVASGEKRTLADTPGLSYWSPLFSPDGTKMAVIEGQDGTPTEPGKSRLVLFDVVSGTHTPIADEWDRWPSPAAFSPDGSRLFVTADEDGECPIFAIDLETDEVRRLTEHGAFHSVQLSPDGAVLYAVRSHYDCPGEIVAINAADGALTTLHSPVEYPEVPGRLERIETTASDGTRVPGWLVLPENASDTNPVPLTLWVHGGPVSSWNDWSWRWCPWLLASRGQAVLLPDPALSTGYGYDFIKRGWGRWGAEPFTDVMALTDAVEAREDVLDDQSVMMGGSFGGYMANWIATQTDRFKAIVSHASLWNLSHFGPTTDAPSFWREQFTPDMLERYSPHRFADQIKTPMLVIHGDKDYRVPIGEGLALWWALVGNDEGPVDDIPHAFLYFPDENHWILTPQHAKVWYETIIEFIDAKRAGRKPTRPELL